MTRRTEAIAVAMLLALAAACPAQAVVLTGEVQTVDAQPIFTPEANISPLVVRYYVPEGTRVKPGDVVLRIDPGESAAKIPELESQMEQASARAAKEVAELRVKAMNAQIALSDAEAALATARVDATIPRELISRLDFDRHRGELDRTTRELALKREELANARAAVDRRLQDGALEVGKFRLEHDYNVARLQMSEVRAEKAGVVLHGFNNNWLGGRIDEGAQTMPGSKAGEIVSGGAMRVRAWALEPDRRELRVGQAVQLAFDALPGRRASGRITAIAGAPDRKPEWGNGRYLTVDIDLSSLAGLALLPGMSVRVTAPTMASGSGARR